MPFINDTETHWQPAEHWAGNIPREWRQSLLDSGSLTKRLKAQCKEFRVKLLSHEWATPTESEQAFLGCQENRASIREVLLLTDGQPKVFARSVLPHSSLIESNLELLDLGCRPLGEFLFSHPSMKRGTIEIAQWPARVFRQYHGGPDYREEKAWGRRSLFFLNDKPISVCEVFLPITERVLPPNQAEVNFVSR